MPRHIRRPGRDLKLIQQRIVQVFTTLLGTRADVYDLQDRIVLPQSLTPIQQRDLIWKALVALEGANIVERIRDPSDHRKYTGYQIPWRLV